MASEMERTRQRAQKAKQRGDWQQAAALLETYRKAYPSDKAAALDLGDAWMKLERFDCACQLYADLLETWPKDPIVASNLGGALLRLGKIQEAKTILEYSLELNPKNIYARINLGGVYQALRDFQGALKNSLEAVALDPTHPLAFNNLGSAFSDLAKFEEAKHAYETAVLLDPQNIEALINLAVTEAKLGKSISALEKFENVLSSIPLTEKFRRDAVKFFASFECFKLGFIDKGWNFYEGGFSPLVPLLGRRMPDREFNAPLWGGGFDVSGRLLVWREQGLGDELMFGTCLADLINEWPNKIIFEADGRMVELWQRTYPEILVRPDSTKGCASPSLNDYEFHIPLGSLPRLFRANVASFRGSPRRYLQPDPELARTHLGWLKVRAGSKRLVGISWRSGLIDPNRALEYSGLEEWTPILRSLGCCFVNLQYGDCEDELLYVENALGIDIIRPPFDLKNDLNDLVATIVSLDIVVSVGTAVLQLAAHAGVRVIHLDRSEFLEWTYMGCSQYPWYQNVERLRFQEMATGFGRLLKQ